ncbi:HAMP domain-containing protein [Actinomycetospora succinea]|uniref:histidine kinase n=1 Tax=Actinomycetospora succinea TaxID=663603 RepID=A0A4R6VMS7_9PSEU|nr:HAMP domain-containing sensor histidine kinase [Actinomycetospora succinea]TDQ63259.1 HAMP domain-containing protein [Actinomycetospora succinea]
MTASLRERWTSGRSLRFRVTALVLLVVALALVVIGVAVDLSLDAQLRRDQQSRLDDRAARAGLLVASGTTGASLVDAVDGQGIRAVLLDASGRRVVGPTDDPGLPGRPPRDGHGPPGRASRDLARVVGVPDGTRLVLTVEPGENVAVLARLRVVMIGVGALGLGAVAVALLAVVRVALRPLDDMTVLANDIAAGDRGRRLHPERTDTELGRTAAAFDGMLDALETAQLRAEDAAAEARSSEARTRRFLSDAAHELRTPVTGVQTLAESLVRHPDADLARRERIATTLVRETRRAGALVADMLELARIEDGAPLDRREVDLAELAAAEAERTRLLAPALTVLVAGPPTRVLGDPSRIAQVLANLLENARRHGPADGTVRLEVGTDGAQAVLDVVDEGPGIPAADRERVFDRLVRLDDARTRDAGGAGLGLPIARALARAHGGDLRVVENEPGARLRLTLPAAR